MLASLAGDAAAYRKLLAELSVRLRGYFQRRLRADLSGHVEDLVQETLLAIHARRMTYDANLAFTAWFYAIARYKLVDLLRRSRRAVQVPVDDLAELLADEADATGEAVDRRDLELMLETLPEHTRTLVRKVKIEERPIAEVAEAAQMSESAVKVAVHRGVRALMARFGGRQ